MVEKLVSIIMPAYNCADYIAESIRSVQNQSYRNWELIVADDNSTDGTVDTVRSVAADDNRIHLLETDINLGPAAARNRAINAARGDYIAFLDSDDIPEPQALYAMVSRARDAQLDVIKGRFVFFDDETGDETPGPAIPETGVTTGAALLAQQCRADVYEPMVWQCAYRRAFLAEHALQMAEGLLFEDELFQAPALLAAQRAQAVTDVILRYRQRAGSIMKSFAKNASWCGSYLTVCRRLRALADGRQGDAAARALCRRVGQIALSVDKNIPAYALPPDVAAEAMAFVRENRRELAGYALRSGDALVAAQGALLALSPRAFVALYCRR